MKKTIAALIVLGLLAACAGQAPYHKTPLPDPQSFNAHFGDMDASGDQKVDWKEFKAYFSQAEPKVFEAIDLNQDHSVDHDEWHAFKDAHGLREHH